eukprot:COSAG01_NODE_5284_length_4356_cov_305.532535_5_plen_32_part_01
MGVHGKTVNNHVANNQPHNPSLGDEKLSLAEW